MIDPISALAAVSGVVSLIKKASGTVDDVKSLGPLIGRYFQAKQVADQSIAKARKKGGSSFLGQALEIEMEISKQAEFEKSLNHLFFETGNIDVFLAAKKRAASMEKESIANDIKSREEIRLKRIKDSADLEFAIVCSLLVVCFGCIFWGAFELIMYCQNNGCGR